MTNTILTLCAAGNAAVIAAIGFAFARNHDAPPWLLLVSLSSCAAFVLCISGIGRRQ